MNREPQFWLPMEIRRVTLADGVVEGIAAPYGETSFIAGDPQGERFRRGAFNKSARERQGKLLLFRNHDHDRGAVGRATKISPNHPDGLWTRFQLAKGERFADVYDDIEQGLLPGLSVGMAVADERRGADGAREITQAALIEVSLVPIGAYDGARVLATRAAGFTYPHAPPPPTIPDWARPGG